MDRSGKPLPKTRYTATLRIKNAFGAYHQLSDTSSVLTDEDGRFEFTSLIPGMDYQLQVYLTKKMARVNCFQLQTR